MERVPRNWYRGSLVILFYTVILFYIFHPYKALDFFNAPKNRTITSNWVLEIIPLNI